MVNNKAIMLYSGHNFVRDDPRYNAKNIFLQFLSNYKCIVKYLQKISIKFDALSRRLGHFEKMNSIKNSNTMSYGKYEGEFPPILNEAVHYDASNVYDTLENFFHVLNFLKNNKQDSFIFFELGAGAELTSLALIDTFLGSKVIIFDLPESICVEYVLISHFSKGKFQIVLPNEIDTIDDILRKDKFDILFLTPNQVWKIPDQSVDVCINVHSMQEMDLDTINNCFSLIKRIRKNGSIFYCKNLKESKQYGRINFDDYPWDMMGEELFVGIAPFASRQYPEGGEIKVKIVGIRD